jgi:HTH-type transcriptional regulator/antitoxin HigA
MNEGRQIELIGSNRDYRRMLKQIEGLMHAGRNTSAGDRLHLLAALVEAWEAKHHPLPWPAK